MDLQASLFSHFSHLEDPREQNHKLRHRFHDILVITVLGTICGADGWVEICEFAQCREDWLKTFLELPNGIPSHDTFGRIFALLDAKQFEACFVAWVQSLSVDIEKEIIAIDGKSARCSHDKKNQVKMLHMVSAWAAREGVLLGQVKTPEKSNEITAIPSLLDVLDVKGSTVTLDAMGCQTAIAKKIIDKGADYVLSLKENQPTLYQDVASIFDKAQATSFKKMIHKQKIEKVRGHGRIETHRYTLIAPRDRQGFGLRWPHLQALGMVEVKRTQDNETTHSKRFFLTSLEEDYTLALLADLPKKKEPAPGIIYLEKQGEQLRYVLQSPQGERIDDTLDINVPELTAKTLAKLRLKVLTQTAQRGHTLRDTDINQFMAAVRKHWQIEINLHWSLDVSFKEDLCRVRIGNAAENLAIIRRICLNLLKQETTRKVGITVKRKRAGWDNRYLLKLLMGGQAQQNVTA